MLRRLNGIVLIGSAIALVVCFWNRNAIPAGITFLPALADAPVQRKIAKEPFTVEYKDIGYRIEPRYDYELYGLVVSYRQHNGESLMHRLSHDRLNMADVCVVWSDTAFSEHLGELDFWNGVFTCNVKTHDPVAWAAFDMHELSNNHLISNDPFIRDRVADVHNEKARLRHRERARIGEATGSRRRPDSPAPRGAPAPRTPRTLLC